METANDREKKTEEKGILAVRIANIVFYILIATLFSLHLYFVVSEYVTYKYVDITRYQSIIPYMPDVAICRQRQYRVQAMDLVGYLLLTKEKKIEASRKSLTFTSGSVMHGSALNKRSMRYVKMLNLTREDEVFLPNLEDVLIRCHALGYQCSAGNFTIGNQLTRNSERCVIFRTSEFLRNITRQNGTNSRMENNALLSVVMKWSWHKHGFKIGDSYVKPRYQRPIHIILLTNNTAMMNGKPTRSSGTLARKTMSKMGYWMEIDFDMRVKKILFCSSKNPNFKVIDPIFNQTRSFEYSRLLCRKIKQQYQVIEKCGCMSSLLPRLIDRQNVSECALLPPEFKQSKLVSVNGSSQEILLYNSSKPDDRNLVANFSFHDSDFIQARCGLIREKGHVSDTSECPATCQEIQARVSSYSNVPITTEQVDSEFSEIEGGKAISDDVLKESMGIKIQPISWKIPVTSEEAVYPLSKLFSDFGGMVGLWLGMSAISLVNAVVLLHQSRQRRKGKCPSAPEDQTEKNLEFNSHF